MLFSFAMADTEWPVLNHMAIGGYRAVGVCDVRKFGFSPSEPFLNGDYERDKKVKLIMFFYLPGQYFARTMFV